jgi:hypothetical protein
MYIMQIKIQQKNEPSSNFVSSSHGHTFAACYTDMAPAIELKVLNFMCS